jgi:RHS repeat-associated protein
VAGRIKENEMTVLIQLNATIDDNSSDIGASPRNCGRVFQKISFGRALARTARCLLAALLCSWVLVLPAHSQSYAWWVNAQTQDGNTIISHICESADALAVGRCFWSIALMTDYYPYYAFANGDCGVPSAANRSCTFCFGKSTGRCDGTFSLFIVSAQYWPGVEVSQCNVCTNDSVKDPINPAVGNVFANETDVEFAGSGAVAFRRFYNSADATGIDGVPGWRHSYGRSIRTLYQPANDTYIGANSGLYSTPEDACTIGFAGIQGLVNGWAGATATYNNGACVVSSGTTPIGTVQILTSAQPISSSATGPIEYDVIRDDGQTLRFTLQNGVINNQPGSSLSLAATGSGFTVTDDDDNVEVYDAAGALQSITSRAGVVQTISYDSNGLFLEAVDSFGNSVIVTRNSQGGIGSIATNGGGQVQYAYDSAQRLVTVTNLDGTTRGYTYGNSSFTNALTAEMDESGTQFSTWGYDTQERATSTQEAGGTGAMTLVYNSNGSVTTTDSLGAVRTFNYTRVGDSNLVSGITGSQCPTCQESAATTYDVNGWVASRTDYNGNITCYANDPIRGLELVRIEGLAPGSTCPTDLAGYTPATGTTQRKISTTWSASFRLPTLVTEATRTTAFGYDPSGNLLTRTITDTTVSPQVSRTWTYTYDAFGHELTAHGPRTDVNSTWTFTYYSCASGAQCGQVQTVTDELGHVTTVSTYNAYGQPLTITDPNGVVTTLTYDTRQRLTSRSTAGETTSFAYFPTGLLHTVTLPDGSMLQYTYDGAHRLTQIADSLGNRIVYTLDALGNHIAESQYDPSNALTLARNQVFNSLSELYQQIGSAGTAAVTTTFGYDSNGNQTSISAPLLRNTAHQYDTLNRLVQITDPGNGVTTINYDVNDDLTAVTDPRSLTTGYAYNGFGDLIQQTSPDTGVTANSYDSGGNLATSTDARSQTGTYTYDARNRVTQIAYGDQTIAFGYDSGTNGVGRLTSAGDANHALAWTYDALGRVIAKTQTVGTGSSAVPKSITYTYTNGDLTSVVTPSGQAVTYGYTNGQVTSIAVNGTALLSQVLYEPFGPVSGWTWGNTTNEARVYDHDGNVTNLEAAEGFTYGYDSAFRITGITDTDNAALSQSYGYDALDRLTSATGSSLNESWTYDANGNRQTQGGATSSTYSVAAASNQLTGISGGLTRTYTYAASGQTTSYGGITFSYADSGRLSSVSNGGSTTSYIFNALGQRVKKSGTSVTLFVYDEAGHLLGEYDGSGNLIEETIWMGNVPVATLQPNGTGVSVYYIHTDHLNTPRRITNPTNNVIVWRWDSDPFGTAAASQNPSGSGTPFVYNPRFPGQYYDVETGLNYNYHRDYDPGTGRYVESDPIGLRGGVNTYAYVNGNPISNVDPKGLIAGIDDAAEAAAACAAIPACDAAVVEAGAAALAEAEAAEAAAVQAAKGAANMCRSATRGVNSLLKQIAKHRQKLQDFVQNPTVRPGMEGQPPEVIASQQADRIDHLLDEINTFAQNIEKLIQGIL